MTIAISKTHQTPTNIGVFPTFSAESKIAINNNAAAATNFSDKEKSFKELVDDYSFLGKRMEHLTKEEQYKICLAYIEHKYSSWPFSKEEVDVPLDIETLRLLKNNIYNSKVQALELVKDAVIHSQTCSVSEVLDDAIETARSQYENNYSLSFNVLMF
jgi:hypothetical protein